MHAELTMKVTNEAPSSTHEWRADRGGEASICLLSVGALNLFAGIRATLESRRQLLAAIDGALIACPRQTHPRAMLGLPSWSRGPTLRRATSSATGRSLKSY